MLAIAKPEDGSGVSGPSYEDKRPLLVAWVLGRGTVARPRVHPPSTSMATSSQYRQLLSDYGPPSLGYTQVWQWGDAWQEGFWPGH